MNYIKCPYNNFEDCLEDRCGRYIRSMSLCADNVISSQLLDVRDTLTNLNSKLDHLNYLIDTKSIEFKLGFAVGLAVGLLFGWLIW